MRRLLLAAMFAAASPAFAGGFSHEAPPSLAVRDRAGAQLPLDMPLLDASGGPVRLGDFFAAGRPVLLVPGYWRCRTLCGTLMQGVLEAAADTGLPRGAYAVVGFSVDTDESPADALARQRSDLEYAAAYGTRANASGSLPPPDLHLLLGRVELARQMGFDWQRSDSADDADRWAHAVGFAVVSPRGRIVQSFTGVRFDAAALRSAIESASRNEVRQSALSRGFAMLCAHFDPSEGTLTDPVMGGIRIGGVALVLTLGGWMLWHRKRPA